MNKLIPIFWVTVAVAVIGLITAEGALVISRRGNLASWICVFVSGCVSVALIITLTVWLFGVGR